MIKAIFLAVNLWSPSADAWRTVVSDSLRLETVNGQTFIVHLVGGKETLFGLSKRYGVTVARILEFNPTADGGIEAGQLLKVPYVPKGRTHTAEGTIHKVQPKETLFSISRMYSVSVDDLKAWNNLKDNALNVGQDILIKKNSGTTTTTTAATTTAPVQQQKKMTHTVAQGETLYSISRTYGVTVDQIKEWNGIQSNELKLSQVIYVAQPMFQPSTQSTTASSTTGGTTSPSASGTTPKTTTTVTPATTSPASTTPVQAATAGSHVQISENVLGTDEVHELGLAELIEGTEGNRKYLALHRTAKTGSILKVRNELSNREVFVRVAGPLPNTAINDKLVIKISKSAFDRLGGVDQKFRVEVTYYK
jgi:LysM repeat protein